jgi:hypothetical protein
MEKPNIIDKRQVRLEDYTKPGFIPFLGGRPHKTTIITKDDCLDLQILLNTTGSVEEFIGKV